MALKGPEPQRELAARGLFFVWGPDGPMSHDTVATSEPETLRAGDNWNWDKTDADHTPAAGWTLTYYLRQGATKIEIVATGAVDHFEIRHPGTTSRAYTPGQYRLIGRISKTTGTGPTAVTERYTVYDAVVTVEPDPVEYAGSTTELELARVEARIAALDAAATAAGEVQSWTQGGRSETVAASAERAELLRQRGILRDHVRVERGGPLFVPVASEFEEPE